MRFATVLSVLSSVYVLSASAQTPAATPFVDVHPYQSQSMIRLADLTILVVPAVVSDYKIFTAGKPEPKVYEKTALVYEKRNPLPALEFLGGNYAIYKGGYLSTLSADGFLTYKGKMNFEAAAKGGNFFTKRGTNEIVAVDSYGYFVETGMIAQGIRLAGGNFFIDQSNVMTTIKSVGTAPGSSIGLVTRKEGVDFSDAQAAGGNYLVKKDGSIVTIDSLNGFYSEDSYKTESPVAVLGGNFFITLDNTVYTIDSNGKLFKTIKLERRPMEVGYSYMIFGDRTFALVTANGGVHLEAIRVGAAGKAEYVTKIPGQLEAKSNYKAAQSW